MDRCALSKTSEAKTLDALGSSGLLKISLIRGEAGQAAWRLVEAVSESKHPFELHLEWSSGNGGLRSAKLTASTACRVCVFARTVNVSAVNLTNKENRVAVAIADALLPTQNQYEYRGATVQLTDVDLEIPPFATHLHVELVDPTHLSDLTIRICDGTHTLCGVTVGDQQPDRGVPVGGACMIQLLSPHAEEFRAIYTLAL